MSKQSDYIVITGSRNIDDGTGSSDAKVHEEAESASLRALEDQGISIIDKVEKPGTVEPLDQFSLELMDEGGIEIIQADEEEESFL